MKPPPGYPTHVASILEAAAGWQCLWERWESGRRAVWGGRENQNVKEENKVEATWGGKGPPGGEVGGEAVGCSPTSALVFPCARWLLFAYFTSYWTEKQPYQPSNYPVKGHLNLSFHLNYHWIFLLAWLLDCLVHWFIDDLSLHFKLNYNLIGRISVMVYLLINWFIECFVGYWLLDW